MCLTNYLNYLRKFYAQTLKTDKRTVISVNLNYLDFHNILIVKSFDL